MFVHSTDSVKKSSGITLPPETVSINFTYESIKMYYLTVRYYVSSFKGKKGGGVLDKFEFSWRLKKGIFLYQVVPNFYISYVLSLSLFSFYQTLLLSRCLSFGLLFGLVRSSDQSLKVKWTYFVDEPTRFCYDMSKLSKWCKDIWRGVTFCYESIRWTPYSFFNSCLIYLQRNLQIVFTVEESYYVKLEFYLSKQHQCYVF